MLSRAGLYARATSRFSSSARVYRWSNTPVAAWPSGQRAKSNSSSDSTSDDVPPEVPPFQPPPAVGGTRRNPVGLGEPVLDGTSWVLEQNRWYLDKDSVDDPAKRITLPHRRGRDKIRGTQKAFPDANKDLPLALRLLDIPKTEERLPTNVNWRETPAVTKRRQLRKRMTEIRKRARMLWKAIDEERKEREEVEAAEMARHKAIRANIREEERQIASGYQQQLVNWRRSLRDRKRQQHRLYWKKQQEILLSAKREWLSSLDQELYRVPSNKLKDVGLELKNQRYATFGGKEWFTADS